MQRTSGVNNVNNRFSSTPPASVIDDSWLNSVQEEICAVVEGAGLAIREKSNDTMTQLFAALQILYAPSSLSITVAALSPVVAGLVIDVANLTIQADATDSVIQRHGFLPKSFCAKTGSVDSSGVPNYLSASTDGVALAATTTPVEIAYPNGIDSNGEKNYIEEISADVTKANTWGTLPAGTSFLYKSLDVTDPDNPIASYGYALSPCEALWNLTKTRNTLLHLDGANGATSATEDYGKTVTFNGTAALSTTSPKFGTASLLTNGTAANYVDIAGVNINLSSFTIECWFKSLDDAQSGTIFTGNGAYGCAIATTAARKVIIYLSTDGTTPGLDGGTTSVNTYNSGAWNHIAVTFEGSNYRMFLNGTLEYTKNVSTIMYNQTTVNLGTWYNHASNGFNGYIDEFCITNFCKYTATFTSPSAAFFFDYYDIQKRKVFSNNIQVVRAYLGEADSDGAAVSAVRNYALNGKYQSAEITPAANTKVSSAHNIGFDELKVKLEAICLIAGAGYVSGDKIQVDSSTGLRLPAYNRLNMFSDIDESLQAMDSTAHAPATLTLAAWRLIHSAERDF